MSTVDVKPESYSYVFSPYREPVVRVKPRDRVVVFTEDAFESRIKKPGGPSEQSPGHDEIS